MEIVRGDITDPDAVLAAADGCEYVIHSAAVLGGQTQSRGRARGGERRRHGHVLDAAAKVGATRVVQLSTTTFFDAQAAPLTEHSPLDPSPSDDPYTGHQARCVPRRDAAGRARRTGHLHRHLRRRLRRVAVAGTVDGGARATTPASRWRWPARSPSTSGSRSRGCTRATWRVPSVVATRKGVAGERYLAFGRPGDVGGVPWFCNAALEIAGSDKRVTEVAAARARRSRRGGPLRPQPGGARPRSISRARSS